MRATTNIVLGFFFVCCFTSAEGQRYHARSYTLEKSFQNSNLTTIFQQIGGQIWVGSTDGLFRFNGIEFKHYPSPDTSSLSFHITAIGGDTTSVLWVGTASGEVYFLQNNQLEKFSPEEGNPKKRITEILIGENGVLWISTYGEGLYYYLNNRLYNINIDDGLSSNDIYSMVECGSGKIWIGTDRGINACSIVDGKKVIETISKDDGLPDVIIQDLEVDMKGDVWIAFYDNGVAKYDSQLEKILIPPQSRDWNFGIAKNLMVLEDKELWIGTAESGIVILSLQDTSATEILNTGKSLESTNLTDLFKDEEGNAWTINNKKNLSVINPSFEFIEPADQAAANIQAVWAGDQNRIWYSTSEGLYTYSPSKVPERAIERHLSNVFDGKENIISLLGDESGNLWIGTFGSGVYRYSLETGQISLFNENKGLGNNNVLSIQENKSGICFGTLGGLSILNRGGINPSFENFSPSGEINASYIYQVISDREDRIWLATDGDGLIRYDDAGFKAYREEDGILLKSVYSIAEDLNGNLWLGVPTSGLVKYDHKTFKHYGLQEGLRSLDISSLAVDDNNRVLIIHNEGLDILDVQTDHINYFGEESGLGEIEGNLNALSSAPNGDIWIGSSGGLIRYRTFREKPHMDPQMLINQVQVFLEPVDFSKTKFPHNKNHFSFDYIGIWYTNPEIVRYRHKLEGIDFDWIVSKDRFASYPKLTPGKYTFKVQATADQSFSFTKTASYSFKIAQPFWLQWWFLLLSFIFLGGLSFFFVKTREKRLKQAEQLEREKVLFQLETLKSQVNPHFLFNSFNTLITIIEEDQDLAVEYVEKLSDFFRSILQYRDTELISIGEELKLLKNYHYLLKKRFEENLQLNIDITENGDHFLIPPLTLQLLVENAVKHNIISKNQPLEINIYEELQHQQLVVSNSLQEKEESRVSTHFGLKNADTRYKLIDGKGIEILKSEDNFIVKVPLIKK